MFFNKIFRNKYIFFISYCLIWINIFNSTGIYAFELSSETNKYGKLIHKHLSQGENQNTIVHIKDLHCNPEIQYNIAKMLNVICKNSDINLIGIEGAAGNIDTSVFQVFPDENIKQDVCQNFIKKGILSGTEYFSICDNYTSPVKLWGLEDKELYKNNLDDFRETRSLPADILDDMSLVETELMSFKKELFPSVLYNFAAHSEDYSEGLIDINTWISLLCDYAGEAKIDLTAYEAISIYNELHSKSSSLNFNKINQELDLFYNENLGLLSDEEGDSLKKLIFSFRIGKVELNNLIHELDKITTFNFEKYPFLGTANQIAGLKQTSNIDKLTEELSSLQNAIKKSILDSLKESDKDRYYDCLDINLLYSHAKLISKLCSLSLSYDEWNEYNKNRHLSIPSTIQRLKRMAEKHNIPLNYLSSFKYSPAYRKIITSAEKFYTNADKRSMVMTDNLITKMKETNQSTAVIVTGGYHSDAIEKYLKQKELSVYTIQPNASEAVTSDLYLSLMMNDSIYSLNGTSANNIAFPVVCENALSDSYFFLNIRRQLAKELVSHKNSESSISDFTTKLMYRKDPNLRATFHNLLFIAGVDISKFDTLDDLITSIDPEKVATHISRLDDFTIKQLSKAWDEGHDETKYQYNVLYSHYLVSILELAVYLKNPEADASEYLKKVIQNTRQRDYNYIHTAAQQRDYDITRNNLSLLQKAEQEKFEVFSHGETATQYKVFVNEDKTVFLKVKRKLWETLKIRLPQILNNYRLFFGDVIVFTALKLCGKNQIERTLLASNRLGGLVPKTAPFKSLAPLKIDDNETGKTFHISEGILQERIDFTLSTMIERYTEENNPKKVNEFIDRIFEIQEKMWERGVFDIDPHFWRNYGFVDSGFNKLVCFDVGMLTDNLKVAELIIRFFRRYNNYISSQLKGKMPEESIAYFKKKYRETFTIMNLNKKWNTAPPVSAWLDYYQDFDNSFQRAITRAAYSTAMDSPERSADITRARFSINQFLTEVGLESNNELRGKFNEVIKDFFNTHNSDIFRNKLQSSVDTKILIQMIALQRSTMFKPLMELVSKIMEGDNNENRELVLCLALQIALADYASSHPFERSTKRQHRTSNYNLIDQSM